MKLVFRNAARSDLPAVMQLIRAAIAEMQRQGIDQWDDVYPAEPHLAADIEARQLCCGTDGERLAVIYVLNQECDPAYDSADWSYDGSRFAVLHRLCVHPDYWGQGIAQQTMEQIESGLRDAGCKAIRLDVFAKNPAALRLYARNGCRQTGTADWRKGRFLLMEKLL